MIVAKMIFKKCGWRLSTELESSWRVGQIDSEATPDLPSGFTTRNANSIITLGGGQKQVKYTRKKRKHGGGCAW